MINHEPTHTLETDGWTSNHSANTPRWCCIANSLIVNCVDGIRYLTRVFVSTEHFSRHNPQLADENITSCTTIELRTTNDDAIVRREKLLNHSQSIECAVRSPHWLYQIQFWTSAAHRALSICRVNILSGNINKNQNPAHARDPCVKVADSRFDRLLNCHIRNQ